MCVICHVSSAFQAEPIRLCLVQAYRSLVRGSEVAVPFGRLCRMIVPSRFETRMLLSVTKAAQAVPNYEFEEFRIAHSGWKPRCYPKRCVADDGFRYISTRVLLLSLRAYCRFNFSVLFYI